MKLRITTLCAATVLACSFPTHAGSQFMYKIVHGPGPVVYSDAQLEKYIEAARAVTQIAAYYAPRLKKQTDKSEHWRLQREVDTAMIEAVQEHGLTVEEYNAINQAIQIDQDLLQRVQILAPSRSAS